VTCTTTFALPEMRLCTFGKAHLFGVDLDVLPGENIPEKIAHFQQLVKMELESLLPDGKGFHYLLTQNTAIAVPPRFALVQIGVEDVAFGGVKWSVKRSKQRWEGTMQLLEGAHPALPLFEGQRARCPEGRPRCHAGESGVEAEAVRAEDAPAIRLMHLGIKLGC
tara:strand:- start:310 stop:804 length:495 start_codon:yes stop_codon:yes gene_type:complete